MRLLLHCHSKPSCSATVLKHLSVFCSFIINDLRQNYNLNIEAVTRFHRIFIGSCSFLQRNPIHRMQTIPASVHDGVPSFAHLPDDLLPGHQTEVLIGQHTPPIQILYLIDDLADFGHLLPGRAASASMSVILCTVQSEHFHTSIRYHCIVPPVSFSCR